MVINNRRIVILLFLICVGSLSAQELGNPISYLNSNEFSVSLFEEIIWRDLDGANYNSFRTLGKTEFGLSRYFKIFGLFGADKLFINNPNASNLTDYKGNAELVYGFGVQADLYEAKKTSFFTAGGMLRTSSRGSVINSIEDIESEDAVIEMSFDWKEYWFAAGIAREVKFYHLYGGLEERATKRLEKVSDTEYVSGLRPNLFLGVDIRLPKNFILSFKVKTLEQNVLSFGISQRSIGKLK